MKMTKQIWAIGAAILLLLLGGGWYFGSPYWTLQQFQKAAQSHDATALSSNIDFEALRTDLKADLASAMQEKAKNNSGTEATGALFASALAGQMIDQMVTPQGVETLMNRAKAQSGGPKAGISMGPDLNSLDMSKFDIQRSGFSEFRLVNKEQPDNGALIFRRDGLGWKLAGIDIPKEAFGK